MTNPASRLWGAFTKSRASMIFAVVVLLAVVAVVELVTRRFYLLEVSGQGVQLRLAPAAAPSALPAPGAGR